MTSISDFEWKGEDPLNTCEHLELYQKEDSNHDDVPTRDNYSKFPDDETSHIRKSIDKLSQEEDTDDDDTSPRGNYSDFR